MEEQKIGGTYLRKWKHEGNFANLVIIHGVGEHSGRYCHVGEFFSARGINVYTGDLLGHGRSDGTRVYIGSVEDYLKDVRFLISRVEDDKPIFVLGHSMGGLIALYFGIGDDASGVSGIIATSPYIKEKLTIPGWKLRAGKFMGRHMPRFRLPSGITSDMLCHDKAVCRAYTQDELTCKTVTAGWFVEMVKARGVLQENVGRFHYPCLVMQAGDDRIVDPAATEQFFNRLTVEDKTFKSYDGFYHEIMNEPQKETVLADIFSWIRERL